MKIISVIGQKGGVGKSTTAQNLSVVAAAAGETVALVDLDSQPTTASWGDRRGETDLTVVSAQVARLRQVLKAAETEGVTLVVIDTAPRIAEGGLEAAKAADIVVCPVRAGINDLETLPSLKDLLTLAGGPPAWVLVNGAPVQGIRAKEAQELAYGLGFSVVPVVLSQRADFGDAPAEGKGVVEYNPSGKAAAEVHELYEFVCSELKLKRPRQRKNSVGQQKGQVQANKLGRRKSNVSKQKTTKEVLNVQG